MPRLHIIYDPTDKLQTQPELENRFKLKTATLSISEELSNDEIADYVAELGTLLLEQVRLDEGKA